MPRILKMLLSKAILVRWELSHAEDCPPRKEEPRVEEVCPESFFFRTSDWVCVIVYV